MSHGPPSDLTPGALVALMRERPRPNKVVPFPSEALKGTRWENVRIVVPPAAAHGESQLAAHRRMRDDLKIPLNEWQSETGQAMLGDLTAKELLARVCHYETPIDATAGKFARWFADSRDVEQALTADEVAVLFAIFEQVQYELGPRLHVLTDSEVEAWITRLEGGLRLDPLAYLQLPDLVALISGLARLVVKARSSSGTSTSQDSQPAQWQTSSELASEISSTDTTSSGSPPSAPPLGLPVTETVDTDSATAIARQMSRKPG